MTIPRGFIPGKSDLDDALNGTLSFSQLNVDNLRMDGNTISSTDTNGNIIFSPNGTGNVTIPNVNIDGGSIDGTPIGANALSIAKFTDLDVDNSATGQVDIDVKAKAGFDAKIHFYQGAVEKGLVYYENTYQRTIINAVGGSFAFFKSDGTAGIQTTSNGSIILSPNGTGAVNINSGSLQINTTTVIDTNTKVTGALTFRNLSVSSSGSIAASTGSETVNSSTGAVNRILPDASTNLGREITLYLDTAGNDFTVTFADTNDRFMSSGTATYTTATLDTAGDFITVMAVSANLWLVKTSYGAVLS